jgi:hypothetical protein
MNRRLVAALSSGIVATLFACSSATSKTTPNLQTSFGTLAETERRSTADPANPAIAPKSGEVAYVLTFRGTIAIPADEAGWEKRYPIVDSRGTEYAPVFKSTANAPASVLVLAYIVPTGAQGLSLKDGAAKHPLGR